MSMGATDNINRPSSGSTVRSEAGRRISWRLRETAAKPRVRLRRAPTRALRWVFITSSKHVAAESARPARTARGGRPVAYDETEFVLDWYNNRRERYRRECLAKGPNARSDTFEIVLRLLTQ